MSPNSIHMFHRNYIIIIALCALALLSFSCEKNPEPLTTNSVITGYVYLDDPDFESPTGFEVVASGPYGQKSASISNDQFVITGLGNGNYYLDYSRENYGSVRQYGIQLFGNDTAHAEYVQLYLKPPSSFIMPSFTNISVNTVHGSDLQIHITTDYSVEYTFWDVRVFMSVNSNVAYNNFEHSQAAGSNYANEIFISPYNFPFLSGTRVYVIGYSCNQRDYGYMDTYNNRWVFSTLDKNNHSNVVSFIMP
jgi:hypothetical protein